MRRLFYLLVALCFVASVVHAAIETEKNIEIVINEDRTTEWTVQIRYKENVTRSDYFLPLLKRITGTEVVVGDGKFIDCNTETKDIGISITCMGFNANVVTYRFRGHDIISNFEDMHIFDQRFSITEPTDRIVITVKLPLGTAIVEQSKIANTGLQRFEPAWGQEGSDGRRIYVTWQRNSPKLGEAINVTVLYEELVGSQIIFIAILMLVAILVSAIYFFKRRTTRAIMPILTDNERKVVEILLRERKDVDQRSIVRETDYSKSKVSRIMKDLESRGLLERTRKGRTNMVRLKLK